MYIHIPMLVYSSNAYWYMNYYERTVCIPSRPNNENKDALPMAGYDEREKTRENK